MFMRFFIELREAQVPVTLKEYLVLMEALLHEPDASHGFSALGAIEAAIAIRSGAQPRPSGQLAYHALDVMLSILESAAGASHVSVSSTCARPALLPLDADLAATR